MVTLDWLITYLGTRVDMTIYGRQRTVTKHDKSTMADTTCRNEERNLRFEGFSVTKEA